MILINSSPKDALKIFQPFLPISVPVGIGTLLAVAQKQGIRANFIDEQVEDDIFGKVKRFTKSMQPPYIFGFSILTVAFKNAIFVSRRLKELYPDSFIVFGGPHPSALPEESLAYGHVDAVIRGEAEVVLMDLYRRVKEGKDFSGLENLSYRKGSGFVHNRISSFMEDIDSLPVFPYGLFDPKKYDLGFIVSSRGCPYRCIFCSNRITTGKKYRYRRAESIISELKILYQRYGQKFVMFLDDNFCVSKQRVYELIEEIKKNGLDKKMTFSFQSRGDNVDYKLLSDLFSCGFKSIFFGLETASEETMKMIQKDETVAECIEACRMAKKIGYYLSATFIYGLPKDTHQDRMDCVRLSDALNLDMVRYNNATPYPGTELYNIAKKENRLNIQGIYENFISVSTFIENPFKKIPFTYLPQGNTEDQIRRDILYSYFKFYFHSARIREIFAKPDQGAGWFKAAGNIFALARKAPGLFVLAAALSLKFAQFFYYSVIKKETAVSLKFFFSVFEGLWQKKPKQEES
ncbi:MAG: radical SAM protein [Candidatus Omnitrophica bacterium]|nr:radical SAM protein [Candidatus Omnitrophota bacterium]